MKVFLFHMDKKLSCRFEDDKNVSGLFEELWEEYTSGERITLHLYLTEIVSLICEGMSSSSWASKRKVSLALISSFSIILIQPHSAWCFLDLCICSLIYLLLLPAVCTGYM